MREKVLIVDDIELNREILAVALGDKYEVIQAADGMQTIDILKSESEVENLRIKADGTWIK